MKIKKLKDFKRGWFIGDFEPSLLKTKDFEIGIGHHKKGEKWDVHYHKQGTEYNYLISGKMVIQDKEINAGDLFIIEPWEIADPEFLEDCHVVVVKVPGRSNDKFIVNKREKEKRKEKIENSKLTKKYQGIMTFGCPECSGGKIEKLDIEKLYVEEECQVCDGTGYDYHICPDCKGKGFAAQPGDAGGIEYNCAYCDNGKIVKNGFNTCTYCGNWVNIRKWSSKPKKSTEEQVLCCEECENKSLSFDYWKETNTNEA
jgi:quercetin dioxygenase-like cupin family protein